MSDIGRSIKHKIFGTGTIVAQEEKRIFVHFESKDHDFALVYPSDDYTNFFMFIDKVDITQKELREALVIFIIENFKSSFSKDELFEFCEKKFSNIIYEDISRLILSEVIISIEKRTKIQFQLNEDNSISKKDNQDESESEDDLYNILVNYIGKKPYYNYTNKMIAVTAFHYYFKPRNLQPHSIQYQKLVDEILKKYPNLKYIAEEKNIHQEDNISPSEALYKDYGIRKDANGTIEPELLQKAIIKFLVAYIENEHPFEISHTKLETILINNFCYKYRLESIKLTSTILLEKVAQELKSNNIVNYELVKSTFKRMTIPIEIENKPLSDEDNSTTNSEEPNREEVQNISSLENELIKCLSDYLRNERPLLIKKGDLAVFATKNFYKGTNKQPQKFTTELLEKIIFETNKDSSIKYELVNSKQLKKVEDLKKPIEVPKPAEVIKKDEPKKEEKKQEIELITNPIIVLELIKSILLTEVKPKQFYTANEIKQYFLTHYHKNPGNLITRKLLIDVCIELYEEDKKYYFVDGDGNSLQLWKATSVQEWQYFGLGTVYNPIVKVKDKVFNLRDFTLYVYESVNSVTCGKSPAHPTESVTINTTTISGYPVSFNAYYCKKCNKYFTTKATIEDIFPQKNYPFLKLKLLYTKGIELQSETVLHIYGYTVKADGPSEIQRENLLAKLLTYGIVTKKEVEGLLWHLIHYNGKKKNMTNAKAKWENDLEFVRDFNLSKQKQIAAKKIRFK